MKYILTILMLFSGAAHADFDSWSTTDKSLFVAHTALVVADWGQTRDIVRRPHEYYETNSILGQHPSMQKVDLFFAASLIGTYYLFDRYKEHRTEMLIGFSIARAAAVKHNAELGLKVRF